MSPRSARPVCGTNLSSDSRSGARQSGFTLLEVMIALSICAFIFGGLFTLAAGSKQLAVRTQDSLHDTVSARAAVNYHLLDNQYRGLEPVLQNNRLRVSSDGLLPAPPRRTAPGTHLLESYQVTDPQTGRTWEGVRWVRMELLQ